MGLVWGVVTLALVTQSEHREVFPTVPAQLMQRTDKSIKVCWLVYVTDWPGIGASHCPGVSWFVLSDSAGWVTGLCLCGEQRQ